MTVKVYNPANGTGQVGGTIWGSATGTLYTPNSDGTFDVNAKDVAPLLASGFLYAEVDTKTVLVEAAKAADLVSIKAAAAPANGAITIAAQPPHARKLQVRVVDGGTHITAGTLTLVGVDQDGNAVTEVISLIGTADRTTVTANAYAKLTSGTVADLSGGGSSTLGIGVSNDFGVPTGANFAPNSLTVVKATKVTKVLGTSVTAADDVAATTTVDQTARTIAPTTTPSATGLIDFSFTYSYAKGA